MALTKVKTGVIDTSFFEANKNVIINGNFDIWQRGTSFAAVGLGDYTADRWQWVQVGSGVLTISQETNILPDGLSTNALKLLVTTNDASLASTDQYKFNYNVEVPDIQRFGFGTSDATELTLSFWVRSSVADTYCISFENRNATRRNYIAEYTIDAIDTWEYKTISLTGATDGTWNTGNSVGLTINFNMGAGSNFEGTADIWNTSDVRITSNQVNWFETSSNTFYLSRVQLEVGSDATPFEHRPIADELARCKRYYHRHERVSSNLNTSVTSGFVRSSTEARFNYRFPVKMRSAPSVGMINNDFSIAQRTGSETSNNMTASSIGTDSCLIEATVASGLTTGDGCELRILDDTNFIDLDAEL